MYRRYKVTLRYVSGPPPRSLYWTTEVLALNSYHAAEETRHTGYELSSIEDISL